MKKSALFLVICLCILNSSAVYHIGYKADPINDGPYVFYVNDTLKVKCIKNSVYKEYCSPRENFSDIATATDLSCDFKDLLSVYSPKADFPQKYKGVDSIIAISDVHGQYAKYLDILKANGVIDKDLNWKFGKGHLVFLGDAFDRGDKVTELLWSLFTLQKQAAIAGGRVHVLLGNHEDMVLSGDLRYMNEKYRNVERLTNTTYSDLYSEHSVLGKWLRNQPVMISVNDILFVHAGISNEMARMKLSVKKVNKLFSSKIIGKSIVPDKKNRQIELLTGDNGPLWYRGYFEDSTFCESKLDSILGFYSVKHIVVGHTTFQNITGLFNNKIIGIDAGIGYEQNGDVLIIKNENFFVGSLTGERIKL